MHNSTFFHCVIYDRFIFLCFSVIAAVFGKGVYYAANSSYSLQDKYSEVDSSGYKHILVCSLLVGSYMKGTKNMKVAPSLPNKPMVCISNILHIIIGKYRSSIILDQLQVACLIKNGL